MGEGQRQALARLIAENKEFEAAIMRATSIEEAIRIAREYGINASADDFAQPEGSLSDAELESASGGTRGPTIFCPTGGPWAGCE